MISEEEKRGCSGVLGCLGLVAIVVFAIVFFFGTGAKEPAEKPIDASIRDAGYSEPVLNLDVDIKGGARNGHLVEMAAEQVLAAGKALNGGKWPVNGRLETVQFTFLGPAGKDATVGRKFLHLTYDATALRQAAHAGADAATVLDIARGGGSWTPVNDDIIRSYCANDTHANGTFCAEFGV